MPAMSTGSSVNVAASSGSAVMNMPSPVLDTMTDDHTARKSAPNDRRFSFWFVTAPATDTGDDVTDRGSATNGLGTPRGSMRA